MATGVSRVRRAGWRGLRASGRVGRTKSLTPDTGRTRARILRVLEPENGGARKRSVLEGLGPFADLVLEQLLKAGKVVMSGDKKGAVYELGTRCRRCSYAFPERLGKYGCPNCG